MPAQFRYAVIENDKAYAAGTYSGTIMKNLPEKGILSELHVQVRSKRAYSDNMMKPNYLAVRKINVLVNGSTVVKSLTARQVMALMSYNGGPFADTESYLAEGNAGVCYTDFILYFGRFAGDTKFGLNLGDYENPRLEVEWNTADETIDGVAYDGNASDPTFTYNIMCKLIDGIPAGWTNKFVMSKEISSYNPSASGENPTEIPKGEPLKGIMLGARYYAVGWQAAFDHVKLDFGTGKWVPIDMDYENIAACMKTWFPAGCESNIWNKAAHNDNFDSRCMQVSSFNGTGAGSSCFLLLWGVFEFPLYLLSVYDHNHAAYTTAVNFFTQVKGWGPMQTIYIPMKELIDGEVDAIETKDFGRIDLTITTASFTASAINHVVAEYIKVNGA